MITKKTVLVLGAGASVPFGFPSGQLLFDIIRGKLPPGRNLDSSWIPPHLVRPLTRTFRTLNDTFQKTSIDAFGKKIFKSGEESIDAFLEYQTGEFLEIGKAAIAAVILAFEKGTTLNLDFMMERLKTAFSTEGREKDSTKNNWYQLLWSALSAPFEEFENNELRVVTFNYDRSLEHYLFTCLKNKYPDKADSEYAKLICPIVHIHGRLGPLLWQDPFMFGDTTPLFTPYNLLYMNDADLESRNLKLSREFVLQTAIKNITVIHESDDETPELVEAREWIRDSSRLIFLGFGYHKTNLSRLKIETLDPMRKEITGTIYGSSRGRYLCIRDLVRKLSSVPPGDCLFNDDVYTFLHDKIDLAT